MPSLADRLQQRRDAINEALNSADQALSAGNPEKVKQLQQEAATAKKKKDTATPRWYMFGLDRL